MTFSQKNLPKSLVELEIEIPAEEVEAYRKKALASLGKGVRVEGFRPGHVPDEIIERQVGQQHVFEEMARLAIRETYLTILAEQHIDAIGEPELHILKLALGNPLVFRMQVAVVPKVELPDYKELAALAQRRTVSVQEREIEDTLEWLRQQREKEGGTVPELSDDFAKSVGNFQDLSALKESVKEGLRHEKEMQETERLRQEILENITAKASVEVPDLLIEREKTVLMEQTKKGAAEVLHMDFEEYVKKAGKSEQELLDSFGKEAEQRVKKFLVLREIAQREGIAATAEQIDQEANRMLRHYQTIEPARKDIDLKRLREYTEGVIKHEKTLQFLEDFAKMSPT